MKNLHGVIDDFIKSKNHHSGCGIFKDNLAAVYYAQKMGENQKKLFRKYDLVPRAFKDYLLATWGPLLDIRLPTERITVEQLAKELDGCYEELLKARYPMLCKSFGSAQHIWEKKV